MRISNWRQITSPYFRAFVLFPVLLAAAIYALVTDAIDFKDGINTRQFEIVTVAICLVVALVAIVYAVRVPIMWFDLSAKLRYRTMWRLSEYDWAEARRIWFESGELETKSAFFWFAAEPHDVLIIEIDDYTDMSILIPRRRMPELYLLMSAHPSFRATAYDDPDQADDSDDNDALDDNDTSKTVDAAEDVDRRPWDRR